MAPKTANMNGGALIVLMNNKDGAKEHEFNAWYNNTHLQEVCATGAYQSAVRFINPEATADEPRYAAVYWTNWDVPFQAYKHMTAQSSKMVMWPSMDVKYMRQFNALSEWKKEGVVEGKRPTGVLVVLVNNKITDKDEDFNKWYNDTHLGEVCGTGSFYRATRYINTKPTLDEGEARYLAIYETDWDDPDKAFVHMRSFSMAGKMKVWPGIGAVHVKMYKYVAEHRAKDAAAATSGAKPAKKATAKARPVAKSAKPAVKKAAVKAKRKVVKVTAVKKATRSVKKVVAKAKTGKKKVTAKKKSKR